MAVKTAVKTVDIAKFKREFRSTAQAANQAQLEETLDRVLEGILKRLGEIQDDWTGGEEYKRKEVEILRKRGLKKLADKRSHRPTWPNLRFEVKRGYKQGRALATISTDNPLFIWLDRGTRGVSDSPKVKIVPVTVRGTIPGVHQINSPGVAKNVVQVKEHSKINGIQANHWTRDIADEVNLQYALLATGPNAIKVNVEVAK